MWKFPHRRNLHGDDEGEEMVITFLPFADFWKSLDCLDNLRLNKQNLETRWILSALEKMKADPKARGANMPQMRMWIGCEEALKLYFNIGREVWMSRGYRCSFPPYEISNTICMPWWFGWEPLHESHKASLLRKKPEFYSSRFDTSDFYKSHGYIWPSRLDRDSVLAADVIAPEWFAAINTDKSKRALTSGKTKSTKTTRRRKTLS